MNHQNCPYKDYLASPEWKEKRKAKIWSVGGKCQLCNSNGPFHVHHRTYERRGCEDFNDLIVLCDKCHRTFHGRNGRNRDLQRSIFKAGEDFGIDRANRYWLEARKADRADTPFVRIIEAVPCGSAGLMPRFAYQCPLFPTQFDVSCISSGGSSMCGGYFGSREIDTRGGKAEVVFCCEKNVLTKNISEDF